MFLPFYCSSTCFCYNAKYVMLFFNAPLNAKKFDVSHELYYIEDYSKIKQKVKLQAYRAGPGQEYWARFCIGPGRKFWDRATPSITGPVDHHGHVLTNVHLFWLSLLKAYEKELTAATKETHFAGFISQSLTYFIELSMLSETKN